MVNWNRVKKRAQRAWREFSFLELLRYSGFLWSVITEKGCCAPYSQFRHSSKANLMMTSSLFHSYAPPGKASWSSRRKGGDEEALRGVGTALLQCRWWRRPLPQWTRVGDPNGSSAEGLLELQGSKTETWAFYRAWKWGGGHEIRLKPWINLTLGSSKGHTV